MVSKIVQSPFFKAIWKKKAKPPKITIVREPKSRNKVGNGLCVFNATTYGKVQKDDVFDRSCSGIQRFTFRLGILILTVNYLFEGGQIMLKTTKILSFSVILNIENFHRFLPKRKQMPLPVTF